MVTMTPKAPPPRRTKDMQTRGTMGNAACRPPFVVGGQMILRRLDARDTDEPIQRVFRTRSGQPVVPTAACTRRPGRWFAVQQTAPDGPAVGGITCGASPRQLVLV